MHITFQCFFIYYDINNIEMRKNIGCQLLTNILCKLYDDGSKVIQLGFLFYNIWHISGFIKDLNRATVKWPAVDSSEI